MKRILKTIFSRMMVVISLLMMQFLVLLAFFWRLEQYFVYFYAVMTVTSLFMVVWIAGRKMNASFKLAWVVLILVFPLFGVLCYLMFGTDPTKGRFIKRLNRYREKGRRMLPADPDILDDLYAKDRDVASQARYLAEHGQYPCCTGTRTHYLASGEIMFEHLLDELRKAQKFIFILSFVIEPGVMWNSVFDILKQKAGEGVDVRVIYDDVGCLQTLPLFFKSHLEKAGIRCGVFNPFRPILSVRLNNRDHRKIVVVDGLCGITGGINLTDEYINLRQPYGHWKDAAILLHGRAVTALTAIFLETWGFLHPNEPICFEDYGPPVPLPSDADDGYVLPYTDSPIDDERVGEMAYMNMIMRANDYVYITTPYLIVSDEMISCLELAAKSGVDIRIITPHIPDKWYVHIMTRASYDILIGCGVRIYEYTPGFIHSKTFVSDDKVGIVGTINLDYRSFYHHFECAAWMYRASAVGQIKEDFLETLACCHEITREETRRRISFPKRMLRGLLRLLSPLF